MKGLLLIDKPAGWTSFDVVNYVRKMVAKHEGKKARQVKVGHTGTLDPAATGLLVLAVGKEFTTKMPVLMKHDKTYDAELTLGVASSTGDSEGELIEVNTHQPTSTEITDVLLKFLGEQQQTPPQFSALKVNGKRAYALARAGKEVKLEPRSVTIYDISNVKYEYPKVWFSVRVSSGTYIRSLAADIGEKLGTGAFMSNLRRTAVGEWSLDRALAISDLTDESIEKGLAANR